MMGCQQLLFKMWDGISCLNEVEMDGLLRCPQQVKFDFPEEQVKTY